MKKHPENDLRLTFSPPKGERMVGNKYIVLIFIFLFSFNIGCVGKTNARVKKMAQSIDLMIDKSIITNQKQKIATGKFSGLAPETITTVPPEDQLFLVVSSILKIDGKFNFSGNDCYIKLPNHEEIKNYPVSTSIGKTGRFVYPNEMTTTLKEGTPKLKIIFIIPKLKNNLIDQIKFYFRAKDYSLNPKLILD